MRLFIVRINKGVRPYGGRRFYAERGPGPEARWQVNVKSNAACPPPDTSQQYADWRSYKDSEVTVIAELNEGIEA